MADNSTLSTAVSFIETALQEIKELMDNKDNNLSFDALKDIYSRGFQKGYYKAIELAEEATLDVDIEYYEGPFTLCCSLSTIASDDIITDNLPDWSEAIHINTEYGEFAELLSKYKVSKPNDNQ